MTALQQKTTEVVDPVPGAGAPHLPDQPDLVQLLTPEGERVEHPDYRLDISDEELRGLYRDLALVRRWDAEATALQRQGELGIWASLLGQEAAQVGAGRALAEGDMAFPTYREHGVAWTRGVDPLHVMSLFRGVDQGGWDPVARSFNLYTVVIGAQTLHATGYAMGLQRDGAENAALAFLGDGATSQGEVNEAMIWASTFAAPVVFFCQNNQYAISAPIERQSRVPLFHRAAGFGFPGVRVDGNDVLAVLAVTRAALAAAREGSGPTFIEAFTYRMGAHTTSDDPTRYRLAGELEEWKLRDPIARLKAHLSRTGIAGPEFFTAVDAEGDELAARIRKGTVEMPDPAGTEMFDHVFAEQTPELAQQREEFVAYHASFEGEQ
ncbi:MULTISPECIES: pyruvate dehydrogenase (acetyl-transferring) E1 component subunit alpha [unclassified Modestobacter]|uniref:pyruvate dehydrogenase (acetyl-transferring) E1 component subunit alpha n=1 Tax=unclassified Modestobacter TaxID=2643866 RepID=UPI0022AB375B|nr:MULTISPECIES: pyruvate dehydrogenase (acetyl-transferring) E1 component subunit alpha [unclassified Modestobacter]MCZ2823329.1 pyruvate dehydrogenase (acetyl-transferring) E1 component subunit alpha [Modestobacter sp. VKM Ac-2981]MCZ2851574.1 pyruvate dehydrogenase (acetyl-transferring) E1 component subunit alpha [Modestobacter sp. VKM Ac-2982]